MPHCGVHSLLPWPMSAELEGISIGRVRMALHRGDSYRYSCHHRLRPYEYRWSACVRRVTNKERRFSTPPVQYRRFEQPASRAESRKHGINYGVSSSSVKTSGQSHPPIFSFIIPALELLPFLIRIQVDQRQLIAAPHERGFNSKLTQPHAFARKAIKLSVNSSLWETTPRRMGLRLSLVSSSSSLLRRPPPRCCVTRALSLGCSCVNRD